MSTQRFWGDNHPEPLELRKGSKVETNIDIVKHSFDNSYIKEQVLSKIAVTFDTSLHELVLLYAIIE